ncbi:Bug family tripartite tricarboxylate transporter substrate binding protein [Bordetella sp. 02P26C-1]|uniref:Bug family tripartite tricarboxylate transporter substrate binding protein n=1 Tax=Bordetella sp. 02P26C-1 TaxID=2683195 RepID=UPI0013545DFB|nr:tripartite tricarboxylate transporter substrate binding protein [Bordetella sp. 02P26C-1]MVW77608.1 tripartite tricarboxylate transporter substrate binding protein [Bordetella sp. 02P26C-1]
MRRVVRACLSIIATVLSVTAAASAAAKEEAYPERPIRMMIPWAVGGSTDMLGRVLAERMGRELGTSIVVENKPGATGTIGYAQVARAPADGYTMLLGTNSTFAIAPHFYRDLSYDIVKDFVPVGMIGANQQVLCVHPKVPATTLEELIKLSEKQPGQLTYASSGVGGSSHLATELLMEATGIEMLHVPYRGGAPALQAILGGQTNVGFVDISIAEPLIRSGQLRALGTSGKNRAPLLPNVPTLAEAGAKDFESSTTFGLFMPAGVPPKVVERVNRALNAAMKDPEVSKKLGLMGYELTGDSAGSYAEYAKAESDKWGKLISVRNIALP